MSAEISSRSVLLNPQDAFVALGGDVRELAAKITPRSVKGTFQNFWEDELGGDPGALQRTQRFNELGPMGYQTFAVLSLLLCGAGTYISTTSSSEGIVGTDGRTGESQAIGLVIAGFMNSLEIAASISLRSKNLSYVQALLDAVKSRRGAKVEEKLDTAQATYNYGLLALAGMAYIFDVHTTETGLRRHIPDPVLRYTSAVVLSACTELTAAWAENAHAYAKVLRADQEEAFA